LPFFSGLYPVVRFTHEQIDINVYPDHVMVKGVYVYKNPFPFPVVQGLSIPLPVDADHPTPVQILAEQVSPVEKSIPIRYLLGKHRFHLRFKSEEEIRIHVRYYQYAPKNNAFYLLTTTKPWRRPIDRGTYRLFAEDVKIVHSNYMLTSDAPRELSFKRTRFMPEKDWHFSWEAEKS
jgi:hypothetical protein